eukprot:TRINITY_DN11066_c0_g1_i10.p1 TRINITY_DN11066_c0_g1~~TRINITY_DN11066_c0_g1_i10.p1  ORF type:complete len:391 (+),score=55.98 TRINITY_DN11066_c0_g1_i10:261-1433(+)
MYHVHGEQLYRELYRNLTRETAFDGLMKVRTSTGISQVGQSGHLLVHDETDMVVASTNADSAFFVQFDYDEKFQDNEVIYFQVALLYTNGKGERRIRVHNFKLQTTTSILRVFKGADLYATMNFLIRQSLPEISSMKMFDVRNNIFQRLAAILSSYRVHCSKVSSSSPQLVLPDSLKLLPIYLLSILKTPLLGPLRVGTTYTCLPDTRSYLMMLHNSMSVRDQAPLLYPVLYEIHTMDGHPKFGICSEQIPGLAYFPGMCRLSLDSFKTEGIYLMDTVDHLYLWIGTSVPTSLIYQLLTPEECTPELLKSSLILTRKETDLSARLFNLLSTRQFQRRFSPEISVIHQGSPVEGHLQVYLVEDSSTTNQREPKDMDYMNFLRHVYSIVRKS